MNVKELIFELSKYDLNTNIFVTYSDYDYEKNKAITGLKPVSLVNLIKDLGNLDSQYKKERGILIDF